MLLQNLYFVKMNNKIDFEEIKNILGREGTYSKTIKNYEFRPEQIDLSEKITHALNNNQILLAEAGTGVGKTMAYLVPAVLYALANGPIIISTNTINLQSQLMEKDIPDLAISMPEIEFKAVLAKGRNNYVCKSMVDEAHQNILLATSPEFEKLKKWLKRTKTGEYQELNFSFPDWSEVASNTHTCKKGECPYRKAGECFYYKMQQRAKYADIVITNHSMFFSDLAAKSDDSYAGVLPREYSAVIFDEAHHIEDNAGKVYGAELSSYNIPLLLKRIRTRKSIKISEDLLKRLKDLNDALFEPIQKDFTNDYFLSEIYDALGEDNLKNTAKDILKILDAVIEELEDLKRGVEKDEKNIYEWLITTCMEIQIGLRSIFFNSFPEENFSWGETKPRNKYSKCTLHSTPIDVAEILKNNLWTLGVPTIMTSATLSTSKSEDGFKYIKERLGLTEEELETVQLGAPFDYQKNAFLYVPEDLPAPNNGKEYIKKISSIIEELIDISQGNAFVLFTSYKMMSEVYANIFLGTKYNILKQGDMSNEKLIEAFKKTENNVLFGVSSFWEGVDVKGEKLRMVILDKIPFPVPTSPLVKSKCDYIEQKNQNAFREYSIPNACIKLKQGFGRLIRTKSDMGVVAILDSRIHTQFYRNQILSAIPPCKGTKRLDRVRTFFEERGIK